MIDIETIGRVGILVLTWPVTETTFRSVSIGEVEARITEAKADPVTL